METWKVATLSFVKCKDWRSFCLCVARWLCKHMNKNKNGSENRVYLPHAYKNGVIEGLLMHSIDQLKSICFPILGLKTIFDTQVLLTPVFSRHVS